MSKDVISSKDLSPGGGLTGVARQESALREEQLEQSLRRQIQQEIVDDLKKKEEKRKSRLKRKNKKEID